MAGYLNTELNLKKKNIDQNLLIYTHNYRVVNFFSKAYKPFTCLKTKNNFCSGICVLLECGMNKAVR